MYPMGYSQLIYIIFSSQKGITLRAQHGKIFCKMALFLPKGRFSRTKLKTWKNTQMLDSAQNPYPPPLMD
jgi:hypothetical protein